MIVPIIQLENVRTRNLPARIRAYQTLFATTTKDLLIKVSGFFADKDGEQAFLQNDFFLVDLAKSRGNWLCLKVDGSWEMFRAEKDLIDRVSLAVFQ